MVLHRNLPKRIIVPEGIYFITTKTKDCFPFFSRPDLADFVVEEIRLAKEFKSFLVYAYVVMPDHFHLLIQPNDRYSISDIMHFIKRHLSRNIKILDRSLPQTVDEDGHPHPLGIMFGWETSFHDHLIRNELDLENHVEYIHNNPVEAGYVADPIDWPWSSYREFIKGTYDLIDPIPG